ncbi:MAG: ATP-grasp domain-containing protein [Gemmatimonadetes bacterium]|nr:ATP-grasp domain-containing protein [Gemmatimonadota bacterium]
MHRLLLLLATSSYRAEAFLSAAARLGVEVAVGSEERQALAAFTTGASLTLDFADVEGSTRAIVDFARSYPLDAVIAAEDDGAVLAAAAAAALGLQHNPPQAVRAARHKHTMRQALSRAGIPGPDFWLLPVDMDPEDAAQRISFPCVLKPVFLSASRGVIRADDPAAFTAAFRRVAALLAQPDVTRRGGDLAGKILVESYLPGLELALEGLLARGELRVLALFDKPDPLEGPFFEETFYITPSRLPAKVQATLADSTARSAAALGLRDGPVHAELRYNAAGVWPLELAPRSIGGLCSRVLRSSTGASLEELLLAHALGRPTHTWQREERAAGVLMIPIPRAGTLRAMRGLEAARAVPGVENVVPAINPGQRVVPLPEGNRYLGFVFARADTPAEVEAALRQAHRRLEVIIE